MTRTKLESLSAEALEQLASQYGIDVPEGSERDSLISLIAEAIEEIRLEKELGNNSAIRIEEKKYGMQYDEDVDGSPDGFGELPESYNETRIVLLLRDPAWAFAYWDIKQVLLDKYRKNVSFRGMLIRVFELSEPSDDPRVIEDSFDIPVQLTDNSWYINLPEQDTHYRLELIASHSDGEELLSRSNIVSVPKGYLVDDQSASVQEDAIIALSGIEQLGVPAFGNSIPQRVMAQLDQQYPVSEH